MTQPVVDVVIATRHRPDMIRTAIDAVMRQDYEGRIRTIIVFDRAEPDESLIRSEDNRSVEVVSNTRKGGLAGARNSGILRAEGDLIAFCDDDDIWHPTKLRKQVATLGDALISVTGITIDYADHQTDRVPHSESFTLENVVRDRRMEAHPSTVLVRRGPLINEIGLVDEELPGSYAEDSDFMIRALQAGEVSVVEEALVTVRWGQSMFSRDWGTIVRAIDYLVNKHEVIRTDRRAMARMHGRRAFANAGLRNTRAALADCGQAFVRNPGERRVLVALPVALGLVSAERVLDFAHKRGRGI